MGAVDVDEVFSIWEAFADVLQLRPLERTRVQRFVEGGAEATDELRLQTGIPMAPGTFGDPQHPWVLGEELGQGATAVVRRCTRGKQVAAAKIINLKRCKA